MGSSTSPPQTPIISAGQSPSPTSQVFSQFSCCHTAASLPPPHHASQSSQTLTASIQSEDFCQFIQGVLPPSSSIPASYPSLAPSPAFPSVTSQGNFLLLLPQLRSSSPRPGFTLSQQQSNLPRPHFSVAYAFSLFSSPTSPSRPPHHPFSVPLSPPSSPSPPESLGLLRPPHTRPNGLSAFPFTPTPVLSRSHHFPPSRASSQLSSSQIPGEIPGNKARKIRVIWEENRKREGRR